MPRTIFRFIDPPSHVQRAVLKLDSIRLAAEEKLDGVSVDERDVPQIQNQLLPRSFDGEQLLKLLDVFSCFDPAAEREQNLTISCSLSSQHAASMDLVEEPNESDAN